MREDSPVVLKLLHCGNVSMSNDEDSEQKNIFYIPMGVFSIANEATLENADVEIIHSDLQAGVPISESLDLSKIDAIGFDLHWINQALVVLETAKAIKALAPHIFTFTGGFSASYFSEEIVREFHQMDAVFRGDSEKPVRALVAALRKARARGAHAAKNREVLDEVLTTVPNIYYRKADGSVASNKFDYVVTPHDFDTFKFTNFKLMRDHQLYQSLSRFWTHWPEFATSPLFFVQPARGCRFNCTFCGGNARAQNIINARKGVTFRSVDSSFETVKAAVAAGYETIYTSMEDSDSDSWYLPLLDKVKAEGLKINYVYGCWKLPSEELVDKLSEVAGQSIIEISPESANPELRMKNRDRRLFYTNDELKDRLRYIKKKGNVRVQLYFGFYNAYDTLETIDETMRFILDVVREFPDLVELAYGAFSTDPGSLLQITPTRYDVEMTPKCLKDYVSYLRRNYIEQKQYEVEMTLFRPMGMTDEQDLSVRRRTVLLRSIFDGFRKTVSYLLQQPNGSDHVMDILLQPDAKLSGKEQVAASTFMRVIADKCHRAGLLDDRLAQILSADYEALIARPVAIRPTSFFFLDADYSNAKSIHPHVAQYRGWLTRSTPGSAAATPFTRSVAFGAAESFWLQRVGELSQAPLDAEIAGTGPLPQPVRVERALSPSTSLGLTGEGVISATSAALQLLVARYFRIDRAPAFVAHGPRALPVHSAQAAGTAVATFVRDVQQDLDAAAGHSFFLDLPTEHLPQPLRDGLSVADRIVLGTTPAPQAGLPVVVSVTGNTLSLQVAAGAPHGTVEGTTRLLRWLAHGAAWLLENPGAKLESFSLLDDAELERVTTVFNPAASREVSAGTLVSAFERVVQSSPDRVALRAGKTSLTYRQLSEHSNQVAHQLLEAGLKAGDKVAVILPSDASLAAALLGVNKAGAAWVPIDPETPPLRRGALLRDSGVAMILGKAGRGSAPRAGEVRELNVDEASRFPTSAPAVTVAPESSAYVIFTSGSTGRPKGVEVLHQSIVNFCAWRIAEYALTPDDVTLSVLSYCFDGFLSTFFPTLLSGGTLVLSPDDRRRDVNHIRDAIRTEAATNLALVPAHFEALQAISSPDDLQSMRFVVVGGEKLSPARLAQFEERFPKVRVINEYGPTETTVACIVNTRFGSAQPFNLGKPVANARILLLDPHSRPVPVGFPGEICVSGPCLAKGYVGPGAEEKGGFGAHPLRPGERMYRTGDIALWQADGSVELLGRADNQVKIRGHRVELGEIEHALAAHPHIVDAVVLAVGADTRTTALCAFYVARQKLDATAVVEHLTSRLPPWMIPERFEQIDRLPVTATGKKDRKALAARIREEEENVSAGDSETVRIVIAALATVLEIDRRAVDLRATFSQLGGDSIRMIMLQREIARRLGVELSLIELLGERTVRSLVERICKAAADSAGSTANERFVRLSGATRGENSTFFIHDVSGEVTTYQALAAVLPPAIELWAIRARDLVEVGPRPLTMRQIAREYLHEIVGKNAGNTFSLGGWSMGGVIAFEVARQLERLGKQVRSLVLIDPPELTATQPTVSRFDVESERAWIRAHVTSPVICEMAEKIEAFTTEEYWMRLAAWLEQSGVTDAALFAAIPQDISGIISKYPHDSAISIVRHMNLVRSVVHAWQTYVPGATDRIAAPIAFIRPSDAPSNSIASWETRTSRQVQVSVVPGDHWTMFLRDHVEELGAAVAQALMPATSGGSAIDAPMMQDVARRLLQFEEGSAPQSPQDLESWRELTIRLLVALNQGSGTRKNLRLSAAGDATLQIAGQSLRCWIGDVSLNGLRVQGTLPTLTPGITGTLRLDDGNEVPVELSWQGGPEADGTRSAGFSYGQALSTAAREQLYRSLYQPAYKELLRSLASTTL